MKIQQHRCKDVRLETKPGEGPLDWVELGKVTLFMSLIMWGIIFMVAYVTYLLV